MFAYPLAWLSLLAVPLLIGIYLLRTHSQRRVVSSLLLWLDQQELQQGGQSLKRLHTPLLFFLELLALLLIALAAAGPMVKRALTSRPLVVVLDASFSLQAGADESARERGEQALREIIANESFRPYRLVLAGTTPLTLGGVMETPEEALARLADWRCDAPAANLDAALALAFELAGQRGQVLALTDQPPPDDLAKGRLRWLAVGEPAANLAIVNAARTHDGNGERLLIEVANYGPRAVTTLLTIQGLAEGPRRETLRLEPQGRRQVILNLPRGAGAITATLPADALALDNTVSLLPEPRPAIRVELSVADTALHELLAKAIETAGGRLVTSGAQLVFTDGTPPAGTHAWVVRLHQDDSPVPYTGPYVMEKTHPLLKGLSLEGVVWGAGRDTPLPGTPVLMVGNVPLLAVTELLGKRQLIHLRLVPSLSTLPQSPNWPILIWNLLDWRRSHLPGLRAANLRLGSVAHLTLPTQVEAVSLMPPEGPVYDMPVRSRRVSVPAEATGRYTITAGETVYSFQVNPLEGDESNLQETARAEAGTWIEPEDEELASLNLGWVCLLLVLLVLLGHLYVMKRQPGALRV